MNSRLASVLLVTAAFLLIGSYSTQHGHTLLFDTRINDSKGAQQPLKSCSTLGAQTNRDLDFDTIPDECEQALAELYAPIIYHSISEPNLPTNVDSFLKNTALWFYDANCTPAQECKRKSHPH